MEGGAARDGAPAGVAASAAAQGPSGEVASSQGIARADERAEEHVGRPAGLAPPTPLAKPADDDLPPWAEDVPVGASPPQPAAVTAVADIASPIVVERNQPPRPVAPAPPSVSAAPAPAPVAAPTVAAIAHVDLDANITSADEWHEFVAASDLKGPARLLAEHAVFGGYTEGVLTLALPEADQHLGDFLADGLAFLAQLPGGLEEARGSAAKALDHLLDDLANRSGLAPMELTDDALALLCAQPWRGRRAAPCAARVCATCRAVPTAWRVPTRWA